MKIRIATSRDIPALCRLLGVLFQQEVEFGPDSRKQEAGLRKILEEPQRGEVLVAERDGVIVGMVNLLSTISTFMGKEVVILEDMVVDPEYRNQGIGERILVAAIDRAKEMGAGRITLLTDGTNEGAIRFYEKAGFSPSPMIPFRLNLEK